MKETWPLVDDYFVFVFYWQRKAVVLLNPRSNKMATISVPYIPEELIGKIVIFLPLKDVSNCMLVCKHWHVSVIL